MNGPMVKDLFRSIKKSFMRFLSIVIIIALGISFFVGIKSASPDMRRTANEYFCDSSLMDIRISSTIGFTDDEVKKISELDGISAVDTAKMIDTLVFCDDNGLIDLDNGAALVCRSFSLDFDKAQAYIKDNKTDENYMNRINLVEGRFPENKNECLADNTAAEKYPEFAIGSTVSLKGDVFNVDDTIDTDTFTIVGTVSSPMYISTERGSTLTGSGVLGAYLYIDNECFNSPLYDIVYAGIDNRSDYDVYSDEYKEYVRTIGKSINDISKTCIELRLADSKVLAQQKIDEAEKKYSGVESQGNAKLVAALNNINSIEQYIQGGDSRIENEKESLDSNVSAAQARLEESKNKYEESLAEYQENEKTAQSTDSELIGQNKARTIYEDYRVKHEKDRAEIDALIKKLASLEKDRENKKAQIDSSNKAYEKKQGEISSKDKELSQTKTSLDNFRKLEASWTEESTESISEIRSNIKTFSDKYEKQKTELEALKTELSDIDKQRSSLKAEYTKLNEEFTALKATIAARETTYKNNEKTLKGYEDDIKRLEEGEEALSIFKDRLAQAKEELESAKLDITISQLRVFYEKSIGSKKLIAAQADIKSAKARLDTANAEFEKIEHDVKINTNKAKGDVDKAKAYLEEINSSVWKETYLSDLAGQEGYRRSLEDITALANVFPAIFFVVAALMCLATMTRMVQEERMQLGTLKALGYSSARISLKYYFYAAIACLTGSALGSLAGTTIFPIAINRAYSIMYSLPAVKTNVNWIYIIAGTLFSLVCTLAATNIACKRELKTQAAMLMRPKAPPPGKKLFLERFATFWNKLSFGAVVTLRNMFRSKRRMVITILGVAGCTMLIVSALGIHNSIDSVVSSQFSRSGVAHYHLIAMTDTEQFPGDSETQQEINKDIRVDKSLLMSISTFYTDFENDGVTDTLQIQLEVPESTDNFSDFVSLRTRSMHKRIALDDSGAVISEKIADDTGVKPGDELTIRNQAGKEYKIIVSAVTENYLNHYIYMSEEYYESLFTKAPEYKYIAITLKDYANAVDGQNLANDLLMYNYISGISSTDNSVRSITGVIDRLNSIILIFIVSAGLLALVTLYNLTNISVQERVKEISTVKVLGFTNLEMTIYVYAENIFHTLSGILLGFIGGVIIHRIAIDIAEVNIVMFGRHIYWWSFLIAAILTALFSFMASLIVHLNLKKLDVLNSFKSVE